MAVVGIINNIHDATDESEAQQQYGDTHGNNKGASNAPHFLEILLALEKQITRTTSLGGLGNPTFIEPNIALTTIPAPSRESNTGLSFVVRSTIGDGDDEDEGFQDENIKTLTNNEALPSDTKTSISLPASLFNVTTDSNGE